MFVHLHCHSHYSFLRGVASPEQIVSAAFEQNMHAVALTDTNGMHAVVPFYQAAQRIGIKPIVGVVLDVKFRDSIDTLRNPQNETQNSTSAPLTLLAMSMAGYSNLCRLVTQRHLGTTKLAKDANSDEEDQPVSLEGLAKHCRDVIALCPVPTGAANAETKEWIARLKEIFGEQLWIEVQILSPGDRRKLRDAEHIGRSLNVPLVATNNVHFLKPEEHLHHRAVNAIRTGELLTTIAPPEITTEEAWFKPATTMQQLFPDHPELLQATLEIAERCNLKLELGKLILPEFKLPERETPDSYLAKQSLTGLIKRYGSLKPDVLSRLTHELRVIKRWKLAAYFLLVWEIVKEAGRRGIPAVARGSAASSMVTYCLGISCVCPLRWGLYFERFLNEQRGDCPDIDIDICGARRDEMLDYVYERWGAEHVAMIGSFVTMHARLAVREVAKVFGVPPPEVDRFTKLLPHAPVEEALKAVRERPECKNMPIDDEPWKTILQVALRIDGAPRHTGIHPCGTVISAKPLAELVPLERATKGIVVTQYDMDAIEALGLVKMDLLGQRGFTTMSLALDNIEKTISGQHNVTSIAPDGITPSPKPRDLHFEAIPENDPETCDMVATGRTIGIFQIESPAMRGMLRAMKARKLEEISLALALIRPGAAEYGSKELFIKRLRGTEPVEYPHPSLKNILGDTLGVSIYQEQVMQIALAMGNMSLAEADLMRRYKGQFSGRHDQERLRGKFMTAAGMMGLNKKNREETWMMVEKFGAFGFCKAHSATYAEISYRMAYLKAHYTAEFLAAMCSAGAGFYHTSAYVEEAKRWGIKILLPSVNDSQMEYTVETGPNNQCALRVGLMQVRGLQVETMTAIVQSRNKAGDFVSLEDFLRRVPVNADEMEAMIKCGAFDDVCTTMTRPEMLWRWNLLRAEEKKAHSGTVAATARDLMNAMFAESKPEDRIDLALAGMRITQYTEEQKLGYELEILEICVSGHPLDYMARNDEVWSDELSGLRGERVTLCGWVVTHRHVGTKNDRDMMFVTLEDQHGVYEVVLFPDTYERYGNLVFETRAMRVTGRVEPDGQINCEMLAPLEKMKVHRDSKSVSN